METELAGAQDTIYLCNFRVSVDGEWLCLRELHDVELMDASFIKAADLTMDLARNQTFDRDPVIIERRNLVNISKLIVKELIEQSLHCGRMLDSDHLPLQHFFIILEHVLRHGLKPKKGILGPRKELWDILQTVEKYSLEAQDITCSVRDLPTVRTHMGRARAWLRLALMQKKLADYLKILIDRKDEVLVEYYEPDSLMLSDESIVIIGLLVGLNVVDCNLCLKEEDLDSPQGVIDFSLYLKSSNRITDNGENDDSSEENMSTVLDQKNYIEELNRHLNATATNLQAQVEQLQTGNTLMKEDLLIARNNFMSLYEENQRLKHELNRERIINRQTTSKLDTTTQQEEMSSSNQIKQQLNNLLEQIDKEKKAREGLEQTLQSEMTIRSEMEKTATLLRDCINTKENTINSLQKELDNIQLVNMELYTKLQECETDLTQKGEMVSRLQDRASQMGKLLTNLERQQNNNSTKNKIGKRSTDNRNSFPNNSVTKSVSVMIPVSRNPSDMLSSKISQSISNDAIATTTTTTELQQSTK